MVNRVFIGNLRLLSASLKWFCRPATNGKLSDAPTAKIGSETTHLTAVEDQPKIEAYAQSITRAADVPISTAFAIANLCALTWAPTSQRRRLIGKGADCRLVVTTERTFGKKSIPVAAA
jgi:hypothetical protein